MAAQGFFSHRGLEGESPTDRMKGAGYKGMAFGENIAAGQRTPDEVMRSWMESPGHCANILSPIYTELGVSYLKREGSRLRVYWVQNFGRPRR